MATLMPKSIFFHVPKTGGTWVREALRSSMGCDRQIGLNHGTPCEIANVLDHKFSFAFVRNPIDWYVSFWKFRMTQDNWQIPINVGKTALDIYCATDDLNKFIRLVEKNCYGHVTTLFGLYTEQPKISFVGKQENLVNDLITALKKAGETFNEDIIRSFKPKNVSKVFPQKLTRKSISIIKKMEKKTFERFNYE